jgi:two-component system, NtrC family, sensor kinase
VASAVGALLAGAPAWFAVILTVASLALLLQTLARQVRMLRRQEHEREVLALQLERRINELFSLQELSYVLAESLQLERIARQVVRYSLRFLRSDGAALLLIHEDERGLRITAAEGTLAPLDGQVVNEEERSILLQAIRHERIEAGERSGETRVHLAGDFYGESGAAAPLRAHGLTMGALLVADRRGGPFSTEDLWLLSTITTQVAVVMANSRLFEMIRQAKEEWETTFDALAEGIAVVDGRGCFRRTNHALARIVDVPAPALIGQPFWETIVGPGEANEALRAAIREGRGHPPVVLRSTALDRTLRLAAAPLRDAGPGEEMVVLVEDVTEQQALERQLIQSEKLAAVGQLVSGIAHELNNPLTSIAGLSELLLERTPASAPDREHLRVVHEQAGRAGRIVQNLLTFARKGTPQAAPCDLREVVDSTVMLIAHELRIRGVSLEQETDPRPLTVMGDRYELQQVLLNLLTNAVQAVTTLPAGQPRLVRISSGREDGQVILRVRDTGPGVPQDLIPQLFTPFFTTKEPGQGTGLGLSISYGIIASHGGHLRYARVATGGSEFTVELPWHPGAAELRKEAPPATGGGLRGRILVVGDDALVARTITALFGPRGYEVEGVGGGDGALRRILDGRWSLIVADPRAILGSGAPVAEAALNAVPALLPRLLLTPDRSDRAESERWRARGAAIAEKPFQFRELQEAAGRILGGDAVPGGA